MPEHKDGYGHGTPVVDLDEAQMFLDTLGSSFTFQTFDETGRKRRALNRVLHGGLAQHSATLVQLNQQGAGVFVMVNAGDGKARTASNVQAVRAVFADLDGAPLAPIRNADLAPHIIVETSPDRWHAYWLATDVPLEQFKPIQQAIAAQFASDPKVCDLPRVMRLPGFLHNKRAPFQSRLIEQHDTPPYLCADIVRWLGLGEVLTEEPVPTHIATSCTLADTIPEGERNSTLFALARGLVNSGIAVAGVNARLQRINAERCRPLLGPDEVSTIASRASGYGSQGYVLLPHSLLDSPEWKTLPAASCAIVVEFYRRYNGSNNGRLAMPWSDVVHEHGIGKGGTFYRHLRAAVDAGILIQVSESKNGQTGRVPAMYAIPEKFLAQVPKKYLGRSAKTA